MQPADFEEKDFEAPLYNQLLLGSNLIATPGQVFEGHFGIDAAMFAQHPELWYWFGFHDIPAGVILPDYSWSWIWKRRRGSPRTLPTFAVNLLVQAKRPHWLKGPHRGLSRHGIQGSYWRFTAGDKQQDLLVNLSRTLGNRAFVVYASTAFHTLQELYSHTEKGTLVENSSFVRVTRMQNHGTWNYDIPGTTGVALSEPEFIQEAPLLIAIEQMPYAESTDPRTNLDILEKQAVTVIDGAKDNPLAQFIRQVDEAWNAAKRSSIADLPAELQSFARLHVMFSLLHLNWLVIR